MADEENDCLHEKTINKFSGLTICDDCGKGLGHWSRPAPRLNVLRHSDGTFEIA